MITNTATGTMDLANPTADAVNFDDIAAHLAKINRWAGATTVPISVAQHSVMVADATPLEWRPYALIHDAHEAYLGDIPHPVKCALAKRGGGDALARLQCALDEAITIAAGLVWPWPAAAAAAVHTADMRALATEWRDLMPTHPLPSWADHYRPLPTMTRPILWPTAEDRYSDALAAHLPALQGIPLQGAAE
jgi:hypothetical protein